MSETTGLEGLRDQIDLEISDLVYRFTYSDRKEDEDLPRGSIELAIEEGVMTSEDMVDKFRKALKKSLGEEIVGQEPEPTAFAK